MINIESSIVRHIRANSFQIPLERLSYINTDSRIARTRSTKTQQARSLWSFLPIGIGSDFHWRNDTVESALGYYYVGNKISFTSYTKCFGIRSRSSKGGVHIFLAFLFYDKTFDDRANKVAR